MTWTPRPRSRLGSRPPGSAARSRSGRSSRRTPRSREPALIEQVFRDEWGRVLACLIGYLGDFDLAEEAAAEAFAIAAQRWPDTGMPDNPGAWLVTTARHRAIDRLRCDRVLAAKLRLLTPEPATPEPTTGEESMTGPPAGRGGHGPGRPGPVSVAPLPVIRMTVLPNG